MGDIAITLRLATDAEALRTPLLPLGRKRWRVAARESRQYTESHKDTQSFTEKNFQRARAKRIQFYSVELCVYFVKLCV